MPNDPKKGESHGNRFASSKSDAIPIFATIHHDHYSEKDIQAIEIALDKLSASQRNGEKS